MTLCQARIKSLYFETQQYDLIELQTFFPASPDFQKETETRYDCALILIQDQFPSPSLMGIMNDRHRQLSRIDHTEKARTKAFKVIRRKLHV